MSFSTYKFPRYRSEHMIVNGQSRHFMMERLIEASCWKRANVVFEEIWQAERKRFIERHSLAAEKPIKQLQEEAMGQKTSAKAEANLESVRAIKEHLAGKLAKAA